MSCLLAYLEQTAVGEVNRRPRPDERTHAEVVLQPGYDTSLNDHDNDEVLHQP